MSRSEDFSEFTKQSALVRQWFRCGSCGEHISQLGEAGRSTHIHGEVAHAHHMRPIRLGGTNSLNNCVILCGSCHYSAHEGGRYAHGTVVGRKKDFPHFNEHFKHFDG
ncbi:HNH endonuclease [Sorangium sp. So ce1182]|uniref:HNH endonuclease n=1 Tax=Sorangium sp. So ce1182 TaxID=3133334 RepID=UPI003F5E93C2